MPLKPYTVGIIPARLASTRLPRKVLRSIAGEPMLAWVYRAARACAQLDQVIIATDSAEVLALAESRKWDAVLTPEDCASGTDRVYHVSQSVAAGIYVNIQGDEPLLKPEHIDALLAPLQRFPEAQVSTIATECAPDQVANPNAVKVVTASNGRALYFSRADHPLRPRPLWRRELSETSWAVCVPKGGAGSLPFSPREFPRGV